MCVYVLDAVIRWQRLIRVYFFIFFLLSCHTHTARGFSVCANRAESVEARPSSKTGSHHRLTLNKLVTFLLSFCIELTSRVHKGRNLFFPLRRFHHIQQIVNHVQQVVVALTVVFVVTLELIDPPKCHKCFNHVPLKKGENILWDGRSLIACRINGDG